MARVKRRGQPDVSGTAYCATFCVFAIIPRRLHLVPSLRFGIDSMSGD